MKACEVAWREPNLKLRVTTLTKERPLHLARHSARTERKITGMQCSATRGAGGEVRVEGCGWRGACGEVRVEGCGRHLDDDSTSNARVTIAMVESEAGGAGPEASKAGT